MMWALVEWHIVGSKGRRRSAALAVVVSATFKMGFCLPSWWGQDAMEMFAAADAELPEDFQAIGPTLSNGPRQKTISSLLVSSRTVAAGMIDADFMANSTVVANANSGQGPPCVHGIKNLTLPTRFF